jgi:hypothetical protein
MVPLSPVSGSAFEVESSRERLPNRVKTHRSGEGARTADEPPIAAGFVQCRERRVRARS